MLRSSYPRTPRSRLAGLTRCPPVPKTPTVLVVAAKAKATPATAPKAETTPATTKKAKPPAYYAVPTGSKKGIYRDYRAEVLPALKGEKGAVQRKFATDEEAKEWLNAYEKGEPCEFRMYR